MMALGDTGHARLIAWLKIILPLTALALLSTVFLVSSPRDPQGDLPFTDADLADRAARQQITAPRFSGTTDRGDRISFVAQRSQPEHKDSTVVLTQGLAARINTAGGGMITLGADATRIDQASDLAAFDGNVHVDSSAGYQIHTEALRAKLSELFVESLGPVEGDGPAGRFSAGRMLIHTPDPDGAAQILFTEGVNLVYEP